MLSRRNIFVFTGSSFLMLMLLWLTVSIPFVNACAQEQARQEKKINTASPLAGTEEEKTPTSPSTVNEYLHEYEELQHPVSNFIATYKPQQTAVYIVFHGELVSPPPEA